MQKKTLELIEVALDVLREHRPMTVRQIYYQLVSRHVTENNIGRYKAVSKALVEARKQGLIQWDWIEDRLRQPRYVNMWEGLSDFADSAQASYRRDVWETQPEYLEVWLEKDALSGFFEDALDPYGVTLNVGRGYDGWDSIRNAAARFKQRDSSTILYFGDFDPSGDDMPRSLGERLSFFDVKPGIIKCALTIEDIKRYNLPPAIAKKSDTRAKKFIAKNGDISVELDALPTDVLIDRLVSEVEERMDLDVLQETKSAEKGERERLVEVLSAL